MTRKSICAILLAAAAVLVARPQEPQKRDEPMRPPLQTMQSPSRDSKFFRSLPKSFLMPQDAAGLLLLREYGSVFVAGKSVVVPTRVTFRDEAEVLAFQATMKTSSETIGAHHLELQAAAMKALKSSIAKARKAGLSITPRGADSARRGYQQTVSLWASRVEPGLRHWVARGKITRKEVERIRSLTVFEQVPEILSLEERGIFFAKDLSKSIIYSVAPPGTSQHLSMLAFDVKEFDDERIRQILAENGWFQTVVSDLPHFTFLGREEDELPKRGLKLTINSGRKFWRPDFAGDDR